MPSSAAPPSSGRPGIWSRKSGTGSRGGVDGQGHLLTHPITWLDERIWGWTRSARRGTNVWAGSKSTEASRMQSPNASDEESEEETGDYDDVLGNIPGYVSPSNRLRSRSLANSYADLQQLKRSTEQRKHLHPEDHHLAPLRVPADSTSVSPTSTAHPDGDAQPPSPSSPRRERRNSLDGNVHVGRLARLDPEEPFKECTEDINRENQLRRRQTLPPNGQVPTNTE